MHCVPPQIPLHLVAKTFLREVPKDVYHSDPGLPAKPGQQRGELIKLSIGGWINLPLGHRQPVSLLLVYRDNSKEHALLIDEMNAMGASEVLLSGEVEILAGDIGWMGIYCGGISNNSVWASNLRISRADGAVAKPDRALQRRVG